jgi:phage FluMu gp28-like protein
MTTATPPALLPYQQAWLADKSPVKMYTKSRRIGISWAEAADSALTAASQQGMNVTYICYDKDITKQFISDCANWAKSYDLAASAIDERIEVFPDGDSDKSCLVFTINFASGFAIEAIAGTPRKLRGRKGRVVIDEAAFLTKFSEVLEAALALLIWGGDLRIITTLNGMDEPYYELEQEVLAGKFPYSRHFTTFRSAISQGLYRRICLVKGTEWTPDAEREWVKGIYDRFGERANQELDCIPAQSAGAYLSRAIIEQCMSAEIPVIKWEFKPDFATLPEDERKTHVAVLIERDLKPILRNANPHLKSYAGQDFGRSGDLSVIVPAQEQPNLVKRSLFALELRNCPFEQQKQILLWICDNLPRFSSVAIDARGNGGYQAESALQRYGLSRVHSIMATQGWYLEWFPKYKAGLEDREFLMPKSADMLDDHRMVVMEKGVPKVSDGKNKGTDGKDRHGDSAIACLMLWYASCNGGGVAEGAIAEEEEDLDGELSGFGAYNLGGF